MGAVSSMSLLKNSNNSVCGGAEGTELPSQARHEFVSPNETFTTRIVVVAPPSQIAVDMLRKTEQHERRALAGLGRASSLHSPRSQTELSQFFNKLLKPLRALLQNLEVGARRPLLVRRE